MEMQHHFTVPAPIDVAWSTLLDVERVAPCMPGATLTKAEGNEFAGSVKVKLGPISLLYKGSGTFTEIDTESRRVVIDASGKDARGNGTASATVTAVLTPEGKSTSVTVDTDLKITGKPAQFGRGLISEVGGRLLNQFAECLATKLAERAEPTAEASEVSEASAGSAERTDGEQTAPAPTRQRAEESREAGRPSWRVTAAESPAGPSGATDASRDGRPVREAVPTSETEPIDLLETAKAPVLKRLVPVAIGAVAVFLLFRALRRARSGKRQSG